MSLTETYTKICKLCKNMLKRRWGNKKSHREGMLPDGLNEANAYRCIGCCLKLVHGLIEVGNDIVDIFYTD